MIISALAHEHRAVELAQAFGSSKLLVMSLYRCVSTYALQGNPQLASEQSHLIFALALQAASEQAS